MSTRSMFLWRTDKNYSVIIKYPPYLFFCILLADGQVVSFQNLLIVALPTWLAQLKMSEIILTDHTFKLKNKMTFVLNEIFWSFFEYYNMFFLYKKKRLEIPVWLPYLGIEREKMDLKNMHLCTSQESKLFLS